MTAVFVHGVPETARIWDGVRGRLDVETVAVALPGFGNPRPRGFGATRDEYAAWLAEAVSQVAAPVDLVGHDWGALLTVRVATAFDVPLRSWAVDVADVLHADFVWHETAQVWQTPGAGEEWMRAAHEDPEGPNGIAARLTHSGVPESEARVIAASFDETMGRCILDLYRSAVPNVSATWGPDMRPTRARGLVLLLPDSPQEEAMSLAMARLLGAGTERMGELRHCWMAEAPDITAGVLRRFWASLE